MQKLPDILATRFLTPQELEEKGYRIEEMHLRFSNGVERFYRRMHQRRAAVLIVPLSDPETVLLVREYSAGNHRYELQLPKGRLEPDEDVLGGANRELKEEVGKGARKLTLLTRFTAMPGFMSHGTDIVLARDLYDERLEGDEPEPLEVVPWRLDKLYELALREDCTEARSIAALYMTRDFLQQESGHAAD
ncbi:MAG TPA: ADP compounds hydrolase NudE [Gammaproteobacteria bacterium]|nr:ADP compounds hydrolase NudE [Gammaproteobacteria bacterium]